MFLSTYANRIKLEADPESRNSESAKIMFDILAKKKIFSPKADDAVLKALKCGGRPSTHETAV